MKKYIVESGGFPFEHKNGEWVPAEVAQALYDALAMQTKLLCLVRKSYGSDVNKWIANGNKALSLADGETE